MDDGRIYAAISSPARGAAAGLAWLWRLGPVLADPDAEAIGLGTAEEAADLHGHVRAGRLKAAVVFAQGASPAEAPLPTRRTVRGLARFGPRSRLTGEFTVLDGGEPVVRSKLGVHAAVVSGRTLVLGADAARAWTVLMQYWVLDALAPFVTSILERPLVLLPAVGCVRLDDIPGTAQQQAQGSDHSDRRQTRRIRALARTYAGSGAVLNVAVAARALRADVHTEIPLEHRWPRAVAAVAGGVRSGVFEPVGHGFMHLDMEAFGHGRIEPREFARLGDEDAGRLIDSIVAWQEDVLGRPPETFVAPAWGYSDGALRALRLRQLPAWLRPTPGPIRTDTALHETVDSAFRGMHGLDFAPFASLARVGLPPTPVFHGGLFDLRPQQLRESFDVVTAARLLARRDILRLPSLRGVRWIGASELVRVLDAHASIHVRGAEVYTADAPGARLLGPDGVSMPAQPAGR